MNIKKTKKAFGIIEVLIASTIVIIIVFALTAVANSSMKLSDKMQERAQATQLAQEGIEIIRQMRDTNWIDDNTATDTDTDWNSFIYDYNIGVWNNIDNSHDYRIAFGPAVIKRFYLVETAVGENINLGDDASNTFNRRIKFESVGDLLPNVSIVPANNTLSKDQYATKVTVIVKTPSGEIVTLSEMITNWRPQF